jgi:predicted enzyme related to lactoylglutathione lyase
MTRVTGIGGIFFKANDPVALREWYRRHLGIEVLELGGAVFSWNSPEETGRDGMTILNISPASSNYFAPSTAPFMINYRVADLDSLIAALREEGCDVDEKVQDSEYGKFGWVMDPEGNRIELWEPPAGDTQNETQSEAQSQTQS